MESGGVMFTSGRLEGDILFLSTGHFHISIDTLYAHCFEFLFLSTGHFQISIDTLSVHGFE